MSHQETIEAMKVSCRRIARAAEMHPEESPEKLLAVWQELFGWVPCKQEGDMS